jgi:hypothetical protein
MLVYVQDSVMHQTDYISHHSFNTVIKNDVCAQRLITVTLNLKKIGTQM